MEWKGKIVISEKARRAAESGHPWIFSRQIERVVSSALVVEVFGANDTRPIGLFSHHPNNDIALRLLARPCEPQYSEWSSALQPEDFYRNFLETRLAMAMRLRRLIIEGGSTGYRILNGEGDLTAGIVLDLFGDVGVLQLGTVFAESCREYLVEILKKRNIRAIWEKSVGSGRTSEGLQSRNVALYGGVDFKRVPFKERNIDLFAEIEGGQKTGFFFDQRDNRAFVQAASSEKRVLNLFGYTGTFAIMAALGGAREVVTVDESEEASKLATELIEQHGLTDKVKVVCESVEKYMRNTDSGAFDIVITDPPAFAKKRGMTTRALSGYASFNELAIDKIAPGGELFTFSCSQHVTNDEFRFSLVRAAANARRSLTVMRTLVAGSDHPYLLAHTEGHYLKGYWCKVN